MILELIGKRLLRGGVTLWMISLFIFFSVELLPGDLAENILGQAATPESVAALTLDVARLVCTLHLNLLGSWRPPACAEVLPLWLEPLL